MKQPSTSTSSKSSRSNGSASHCQRAYRYAAEKAETNKPVPKYIRQQARRYVEAIDKKIYPFNKKDVELWGEFIETLPYPEGEYSGTLTLRDWQCWLLAQLIGFRKPDKPDRRLFQELFLVVPRKAGKSTLGAALCLADICVGGRNGPVVVNAGPTERESRHIFRRGCRMVNQSKDLRSHFSLKASGRQIWRKDESNAVWYPESGELKDGEIPTTFTYDEPHASRDKEGIGIIRTAFGATRDPLFLMTTTAGDLPDSIGLMERERIIADFRGVESNPHRLGLLYEDDEEMGLEEDDPALWAAVHPMLNDTVEEDWYRTQYLDARNDASELHSFRTRLLCRWGRGDAHVFIPMEEWDALEAPPDFYSLRRGDLVRAWIGLDTSDNIDLTSFTILGETAAGNLQAWWRVFVPRVLIPEEAAYMDESQDKGSVAAYNTWARDGWLHISGEKCIDQKIIAGELSRLMDRFPVRVVVVDQHSGSDQVWDYLPENKRALVKRLPKTANNFTSPCKELMAKVRECVLQAEKNPVARWCVDNAIVERRISGAMLPMKATVTTPQKIDALDSLLLALSGRMIEQREGTGRQPMRIDDIATYKTSIQFL